MKILRKILFWFGIFCGIVGAVASISKGNGCALPTWIENYEWVPYVVSVISLIVSSMMHSQQNKYLEEILAILKDNNVVRFSSTGGTQVRSLSPRLVAIVLYAMYKANKYPNKSIDYTKILPKYSEAINIVIWHIFAAFPKKVLNGTIGDDNVLVVTKFDENQIGVFTRSASLKNHFTHFDNEGIVTMAAKNIKTMLEA